MNQKSLKIQCFLGWCYFKLEKYDKVNEVIQKAEEIFELKSQQNQLQKKIEIKQVPVIEKPYSLLFLKA